MQASIRSSDPSAFPKRAPKAADQRPAAYLGPDVSLGFFQIVSRAGSAFEFRLPGTGSLYVERDQTWRLTDAASGVFDDVTVELVRDV
jgi:hypothetical protein